MPCALSHGSRAHLGESQHGNSLFDIMEWIVGVAPHKLNIWLCIDSIPSKIIYLLIPSPIHKHELGTIDLLIKKQLGQINIKSNQSRTCVRLCYTTFANHSKLKKH